MRLKWMLALLACVGTLVPGVALAQNYTYTIYVDNDNNSATGCNENGFSGADVRLQIVTTGGASPSIVDARQAKCGSGTFGMVTALPGGAALGFGNGVGGSDVIELSTALSYLRPYDSYPARLGAYANSAIGSDQLYSVDGSNNGGPINYGNGTPTAVPLLGVPMVVLLAVLLLWIGARRARRWRLFALLLSLGGVVWAAQFVVDGQVGDWNGRAPLATDPAGDATSGQASIDLRALFMAQEDGKAFLRLDVTRLRDLAPILNTASATTLEDTPVTLTLSGSDPQGGALIFSIATAPAHGTLGAITPIDASSASVQYTPNPDSNGADSFTFSAANATASSAATASLSVTAVNDAPQFTAQNPPAVAENAGPQTATVATAIAAGPASAGDEATQSLNFIISANDNAALFAAPPSIDATGVLSYEPAAHANGTATLTIVLHDDGGTANGGVDSSAAQQVTVTVTAVDDAPVLVAGGTLAYVENDPARVIDGGVTVSDIDGTTIAGATVRISAGYQNGADVLAFVNTGTISGTFNATNATLTLSGVDTLANYQAALRSVTYVNTSDDPDTTARTVTWQANDGNGNSAAVTSTIQVTAVNDAATITAGGTLAYVEGSGAMPIDATVTVGDVDNTHLVGATVQISGGYTVGEDVLGFVAANGITGTFDAGTGTLTLNGSATLADYQSALRAVTYNNMSANPTLAARSIAWQVNDGSAPSNIANSAITLTAVANAPVVVAGGTLAYTEGDAAKVVDASVAVSDADSPTLAGATVQISTNYQAGADQLGFANTATITATWNAASGTLSLAGADTPAAYQAALRSVTFVNSSANPSTAPRTVTFTASDGGVSSAPAFSTINITAINTAPVLAGGATVNYSEDAPALAIDATLTVSDVDNTTLEGAVVRISGNYASAEDLLEFTDTAAITGNFQPATGVLTLSGSDTLANYQAALRSVAYRNTSQNPTATARTVSFLVTDGALSSNTIDSTIQVTPVNDAPVVTAGNIASFQDGGAPVIADSTVTVSDIDGTQIVSAKVQISTNFNAAQDVLSFTPSGAITGSYDSGLGVLSLTGSDTLANYQAALRSVTYHNTSSNPSTAARTLSWTANDGALDSSAATSQVDVLAVNSAPVFTKGADVTVNEDAGAQVLAAWATGISDGDGGGQALNFQITGNSNAALFSVPPAVSAAGALSFTPAANASGTATITLVLKDDGGTANGGIDTSGAQSFTITVSSVNDAPSFTKGADPSALEDSGAQSLTNWASAISPGPSDEASQSVSFQVTGNSNPGLFAVAPAVAADGTLTYTPAADANGSATLTLVLKDDGGTANGGVDTSAAQTFTINVTPVNDAPSFVKGADEDVFDDAAAIVRTGWASAVSAGPANESGQNLTFVIDSNDNPAAFAAGPTIAADGTLSYTPAVQNAAGSLTANITVSLHDDGGTANGGINASSSQSFKIKITHKNRAPTLTNPIITYDALGNTQLQAGGAVLAGLVRTNDALGTLAKAVAVDTDGPSPPSVVAASGSSANGGSFSIATDGSFSYVPAAGFVGIDTFSYTVSDGMDGANGTVSITVAGPKVWYVSNLSSADNPSGGDGRSNNAFDTLAGAESASGNGDIIFVFRGNTGATPLGGITLKDGQRLWGEGVGLTVGSFGTLVAAGSQPILSSAADTVTVAASSVNGARSGVEVRGLQINGNRAVAVSSANNAALGLLVSDNDLRTNAGGSGGLVVTAGSTGTQTLAINNNSFQGAAGNAIKVTRSAGTLTVTGFADNTVVSAGTGVAAVQFTGPNIVFDATPGGAYQAVSAGTWSIGSSSTPVAGGGMALDTVGGDLSFSDLDIYAGNMTALSVTGTGPVNVGAGSGLRVSVPANVSSLSATAGAALNLQNMTAALPFADVSSSGSATTAFNVDTVNGAISAGATSAISGVTSAALASLRVNNSSAVITYGGTINATTSGGGVVLTGATISLTGALNLATGNKPAFTATGGGSVTASNPANVLATTAATALNVANTTIAPTGLVFTSISASGAGKGIVLNNTGTVGGLSVSGVGTTAGSGGTIQNISQRGAEFISTSSLSLKNMSFTNANTTDAGGAGICDDLTTTACNAAIYLSGVSGAAFDRLNISGTTVEEGINGNNVSNFTLSNSTLTNCGTSGGGDLPGEEGCIKMRGLSGTSAISNSDIAFPGADVVEIVNTGSESLTLNVDNSIFRDSQSSATGNTGLQIRSQGSSSAVVNVTNSKFLRIRTTALHATAIGTAHGDIDVSTSTFDPGSGAMIGMDLDADDSGVLVFNVQNNVQIWSRNGPAINVFGDTNANINGRIRDNPDVKVLANAGSNVGSGIRSNINKDAVARLLVQNNTVTVASDDSGIDLSAIGKTAANPGGATSTLDATVTNNNVTLNGAASAYGIVILSATNAGNTNALCTNLANNNVVRNPSSITSLRTRVPSANGYLRMQGFSSNPEATWNARSNTPASSGGSEVSYGGGGSFGPCTAQLPSNPPLN